MTASPTPATRWFNFSISSMLTQVEAGSIAPDFGGSESLSPRLQSMIRLFGF